MPQSFSQVILHLVFSTKDRIPLIDDELKPRLHAYLATVLRGDTCGKAEAFRIGGMADHVHIACTLPRTITQADLIKQVKTTSSSWIKEQETSSPTSTGKRATVPSPLECRTWMI